MPTKVCKNVQRIMRSSVELRTILKQVMEEGCCAHPDSINNSQGTDAIIQLPTEFTVAAPCDGGDLSPELLPPPPPPTLLHASDVTNTPPFGVEDESEQATPNPLAFLLDESPVPLVQGPLTRLRLGQVLRGAGKDYAFALLLAAVVCAVESFQYAMQHPGGGAPVDATSIAVGLPAPGTVTGTDTGGAKRGPISESDAQLSNIYRAFKVFNRIGSDSEEDWEPTDSDIDGTEITRHAAQLYSSQLDKVLRATEFIFAAVQAFQLNDVWDTMPRFQGNEVLQLFPNLPQGPVVAQVSRLFGCVSHKIESFVLIPSNSYFMFNFCIQIKESQIEWMLSNPNQPESSLLSYLRDQFRQYL